MSCRFQSTEDSQAPTIKFRRHGKKFSLDDNVRVKVSRINAFRSEIDFELVQTSESRPSKIPA